MRTTVLSGVLLAIVGWFYPAAALASSVAVTGAPAPKYAAVDRAVEIFMRTQNIHNAEFAMSEHGKVVLSHAYAYGAAGTMPATIFRLASISKAWTSAATYTLFRRGTISRSTLAFNYLGITKPLPARAPVDPRVFTITVTYAYCNICYVILAMIVAKASHMTYEDYVVQDVAAPMGVSNLKVSPTLEPRLPGEVRHYYSIYTGLSAIYVRSAKKVPDPNGGDSLIRSVDLGAGGWATNAESMLALMDRYLIWGVGPLRPGAEWARDGSDEGTNTWAEQRADNKHWAFLINTRNYKRANAFGTFAKQIDKLLNKVP